MRVRVTSHLRSYTAGAAEVEADGATVCDVLAALDRAHPGIRFRIVDEQDRIRPQLRIAVNGEVARTLDRRLAEGDVVSLLAAPSGG